VSVSIVVRKGDDRGVFPIITCDGCNQEITDGSLANVAYGANGTPLVFAHSRCPDGFCRDRRDLAWMPLSAWWVLLGRGLNIDPRAAEGPASIFGMSG
jgi:hypothetical protein